MAQIFDYFETIHKANPSIRLDFLLNDLKIMSDYALSLNTDAQPDNLNPREPVSPSYFGNAISIPDPSLIFDITEYATEIDDFHQLVFTSPDPFPDMPNQGQAGARYVHVLDLFKYVYTLSVMNETFKTKLQSIYHYLNQLDQDKNILQSSDIKIIKAWLKKIRKSVESISAYARAYIRNEATAIQDNRSYAFAADPTTRIRNPIGNGEALIKHYTRI